MKNLFLLKNHFVLILWFTVPFYVANAQSHRQNIRIQSYLNSYMIDSIVPSTSENVIYLKNNDKFIYLEIRPNSEAELVVFEFDNEGNLRYFINNLKKTKRIFYEWDSISIANKIKYVDKQVPVFFADIKNVYFLSNGKWYREHGLDIWMNFFKDSIITSMILNTDYISQDEEISYSTTIGYMTNPTTNYKHVKVDGVKITFLSLDEIDSFISKLEKAIITRNNNLKNSKLFN